MMSKLGELQDYHAIGSSRSEGSGCVARGLVSTLGEGRMFMHRHTPMYPNISHHIPSCTFTASEMVAGLRLTFISVSFLVLGIIRRDRGTVLVLVQIITHLARRSIYNNNN